ncbi:MAG: hypothetical protein HQK60_01220 [Deltaproteobacteria bacterium]|nr:hypothetical protein [Deltaproteobacteria bacterium]
MSSFNYTLTTGSRDCWPEKKVIGHYPTSMKIRPGASQALWCAVVILYVWMLPEVTYLYRLLLRILSPAQVGNIPAILTILAGMVVSILLLTKFRQDGSRMARPGGALIVCALIASAMPWLENLPNKNIHLVEYGLFILLILVHPTKAYLSLLLDVGGQCKAYES